MSDAAGRGDELRRQTEGTESNILVEFIAFASQRKKWWLLPVFAALLVIGLFITFGGSAMAPLIYTLF